jgi:hypothetical protein
MWSAGEEGPTARVLPELKLQDLQAREDYDAALKTINSSKTLNDTEKLAQSRELKDWRSVVTDRQASWGGNIKDRLDTGLIDGKGSALGKSSLYSAYGAGGATFLTELISGESAIDAAKKGLKVGAATYIGSFFGPLGTLVGGILGGRVICNELMRQGVMTREHVVLDYRFTRDYLTPTHVKGYHVWAVWMVKQMRNGRMVKLWAHIAGHRANEIAHIYGKRDKPDYLGKVYRKILEPICWSIGLFCKQTDWSILYKTKEI